MKYVRKDLLTLLISLFILAGCNNPSGIGLEVSPEDQIDVKFTDTVSLQSFTLRDDSNQSQLFNQIVFGLFRDPVFGTHDVGLAIDMARPEPFTQIRDDAEIDSVVLVLPYGREYFGDTLSSKFFLKVRQLDEPYIFNGFSSKTWEIRDRVIGTAFMNRYSYKQNDSLTIVKHISGKDSTIKVIPQLRIPLDKQFFKELLSVSASGSLGSAVGFRNHVKGLYLSVDPDNSVGIGGLVSFFASSGISGVEMTYRQSKDPKENATEDPGIDTIRTLLPIYPFSANSGTSLGMTNSVQSDYAEEILESLENLPSGMAQIYLHAPAGLRGKIVFPHLDQLKNKGLSINKAELVLYVDEEKMSGPFNQAAPRLTLYREDIAGRRQNIPDGAALNTSGYPVDVRSLNFVDFGGWYSGTGKRYIFHVTSYIQDVLQGKINGNELFIAPVSVYDQYIPIGPALNTGSRVVIGGAGNPKYKMKLNLYYTEAFK